MRPTKIESAPAPLVKILSHGNAERVRESGDDAIPAHARMNRLSLLKTLPVWESVAVEDRD